MKNNAHLDETEEHRLKRFQDGPPAESILTLLNSIDNYFNNEIQYVLGNETYQTTLMLLGIHAAILTISEAFYDQTGLTGYKRYLEQYVDGNSDERKFSLIAERLHKWRNVLAHQWLSASGHGIGYAYEITEGWKEEDGILYINPSIYAHQYIQAFRLGGKLWDYRNQFSESELESIKMRIINKYMKK